MYSLCLLTAMTVSPDTPHFDGFWTKHCFWESCWPARYGWTPCGGGLPYYPTAYYSCCGNGGYGGGWGYGGYGGYAGIGGFTGYGFGHGSGWGWGCGCGGCGGCGGCWSSCFGYGWFYRAGGAYGFGGWSPNYAGYGGGFNGGGMLSAGSGYAGFGAYGNFGMYGTVPQFAAPTYVPPPGVIQPTDNGLFGTKLIETKPVKEYLPPLAYSQNTATITLSVPEEAKVFINNIQMKSKSKERKFTTPELKPDTDYYYTIRVVINHKGNDLENIRRVKVRAGRTSTESFAFQGDAYDDRRVVEIHPR